MMNFNEYDFIMNSIFALLKYKSIKYIFFRDIKIMKFAILLLFLISINCIDIADDLFTWPGWPAYEFKTWSGLIDLDDDGVTRYVEFHY